MTDEAYELSSMALRSRELLRERAEALISEVCAWAVGMSDLPHHRRRHGKVVPTGMTLGERATAGQLLGGEEDGALELGEAQPGTFRDALNALTADGALHLARLEAEVLVPFVLDTCVLAAARLRTDDPAGWEELLTELAEDGHDLPAVVRATEWEVPLRLDAEELVVAALGEIPLVEVEGEGLSLSLVRAAEALTREAAPPPALAAPADDLAGALFLAEVAVGDAGLSVPVPPESAGLLLEALLSQGLEEDEVVRVLPHLPVMEGTADFVEAAIARRRH